jgi:sugar phosphate isomerase/epimerase
MMNKTGYRIDDQKIDGNLSNLRTELDSLKKIGLQCVELPAHGMDVIRNCEIDAPALNKVKAVLGGYDLEYTVHCVDPMNLMDEDNIKDNLAVFESSLEFCRQIKSNVLVYHPGRFIPEEEFVFNYGKKTDEARREELTAIERTYIREKAAAYPEIKISMENARPYKNMPYYCYAEEMDKLMKQIKAIGCPNVGMTLDVGHLNLSAGYYKFDPLEAVAAAKEIIFHVHLHDNFGKVCYYHEKKQTHLIPLGKGDCHMPIGRGNAPIKAVINCLGAGYKGIYVFEYRSRYKEFLKESVEKLKLFLSNTKQ